MRPEQPTSYYAIGSDRIYLTGAALVLASYVVEAPLRYLLGMISATLLIYVRDLVIIAYVAFVVTSWIHGQRNAFIVPAVVTLLVLHTLIGMLILDNLIQPLFGLKSFLALLLGIVVGPLVRARPRQLVVLAWWCFVITAIGVVLSGSFDLPWIGASFDTPLGVRELSPNGGSGGEARLRGFTRASYIATQLMLSSLVPILATRPRVLVRDMLISVAATIIVMTTSKAPLIGLAALLVEDLFLLNPSLSIVTAALAVFLYIAGIGLPLVSVQMGVTSSTPAPGWAESVVERVTDMWPRAFALYESTTTVLIGRGLGGIGSAQHLAEPKLVNSADNLMLFLLLSVGLAGPIYLGLIVVRVTAAVSHARFNQAAYWACNWMIAILAVGLTSQLVKDSVTSILFGYRSFSRLRRTERTFANEAVGSI